jgi:hypothetical protein
MMDVVERNTITTWCKEFLGALARTPRAEPVKRSPGGQREDRSGSEADSTDADPIDDGLVVASFQQSD